MFVIVSWLGFWIDAHAAPVRVSLAILMVLIVVTKIESVAGGAARCWVSHLVARLPTRLLDFQHRVICHLRACQSRLDNAAKLSQKFGLENADNSRPGECRQVDKLNTLRRTSASRTASRSWRKQTACMPTSVSWSETTSRARGCTTQRCIGVHRHRHPGPQAPLAM